MVIGCALALHPAPGHAQDRGKADQPAAILAAFLRKCAVAEKLASDRAKLEARERGSLKQLALAARAAAGSNWESAFRALVEPALGREATEAARTAASNEPAPPPLPDWPAKERAWRKEWGAAWAKLVADAAKAGRSDLALAGADAAIRRDPSQRDARVVLGHEEFQGVWIPTWMIPERRAGRVFHAVAGWILPSDLTKVESGLLPDGATWSARDVVSLRHASWRSPWLISRGRWQIAATTAADDLEFVIKCIDNAESVITREFSGYFSVSTGRIIPVKVFRDREQFRQELDELHNGNPDFAARDGYFSTEDGSVHVAWGNMTRRAVAATLVHEATHAALQLAPPFDRAAPAPATLLLEVPALLVEDLAEEAKSLRTAGDPGWSGHLARVAESKPRVPLSRVLELNAFSPDVPPELMYPTALAIARFMFLEGDLRRREAFLEHLRLTYTGQASLDLFEKLIGVPWPKLEAEWTAYLDRLATGK